MAEHHGARWVLFENVCELVSKFKSFFGTVKQYFRGKELLQIAADELHHQELGGMTRRSRVWPVFEDAGVTGLLPPWHSSTSCVAAGRVRDALCSVAAVCSDELPGKYIAHSTPVTGRGGVVCVGDLWMGRTHAALSRGCHVELGPDKGSSLV